MNEAVEEIFSFLGIIIMLVIGGLILSSTNDIAYIIHGWLLVIGTCWGGLFGVFSLNRPSS